MATSPLIQFRAVETMAQQLQGRTEVHEPGAVSETARRDLNRYYLLLATTLAGINLSYEETMLIVDALNGYRMTPELPQLLAHQVKDAIQMDGLDQKLGVDQSTLMWKLETLLPAECLAITDAVERWWVSTMQTPDLTHRDRCIRVGLIRPPRKELTPQPMDE